MTAQLGAGPIRRLAFWDRVASAVEHNYAGLLGRYQVTEQEVLYTITAATRGKWELKPVLAAAGARAEVGPWRVRHVERRGQCY